MKLYKSAREASRHVSNILIMLMSVICATAMWYMVSVRDRLEAQLDVNLDYQGVPANLIITKGLESKVTIRLRGPETLLRTIPREMVRKTIDLSAIKKGENTVPLGSKQFIPEFRAFDLIDIQPPRIDITADTLMERSVRVKAKVESPLGGKALTIEGVSVNPGTVILKGPESIISKMTEIPVILQADAKSVGIQQNKTITLDTPGLVTSIPSAVDVRYTITSGRTVLTRICKITVAGAISHIYETDPKELTVRVEVPDAMVKDAAYLNQLEATVVPPDMTNGQTLKLKPRFRMPEGMSFATQPDKEVTVTRIAK